MADIQKQFDQFHEAIKLKKYGENKTLREKRDIVLSKLRNGINVIANENERVVTKFDWFNQGSYDVDMGIQPLDGDYDIDLGVVFTLDMSDYENPVEVKKWVKDALDGHTKSVEMMRPCVRVQYEKKGEPVFHVDLAIYAKDENTGEFFLATGYEGSSEDRKVWVPSDPNGLKNYFQESFEGQPQAKRVVRALKRWKDIRFSSKGNSKPPSIGLTLATAEYIRQNIEQPDLEAILSVVQGMLEGFDSTICDDGSIQYRLVGKVPVKPKDDVFRKMSEQQMESFQAKLVELRDALEEAGEELDPVEACSSLQKLFGQDFPVPAKSDTGLASSGPAIISSGTSA